MNRLLVLSGVLVFAVALIGTGVQAEDKDDKFAIGDFMKKAHGKAGLREKVTKALVKEKDYDAAKAVAKEWLTEATKLAAATPGKGEKESWEKLAKAYCKNVKNLTDACEGKDEKKAKAALGAIGSSCGACHKAHKGK